METEIIQQLGVIAKNIQALAEPKFIEYMALILSVVSILFAIRVPKQIADRQDRIALFEKRYECFQLFERCVALYRRIEDIDKIEDLEIECYFMLGKLEVENIDLASLHREIKQFEFTLHQMQFLFPKLSECDLHILFETLQEFICSVLLAKDMDLDKKTSINRLKQKYVNTMKNFTCKYTVVIFEYMNIFNNC